MLDLITLMTLMLKLCFAVVGLMAATGMYKQLTAPNWRKTARLINSDWRI